MATSWADASEITCGLLLTGKISSNAVREEIFLPPYDEIVKLYKSGTTEIEDIIEQAGLSPVQASLEAVKSLNGLSKSNWAGILESTASMYTAGIQLEKISKKLKKGEDVDWSVISSISKRAQDKLSSGLVPLSQVKRGGIPFILSGWPVIDDHLGGIPAVGLITVGGLAGTGKTTWLTRFLGSFAKYHKEKNIAFFSLEMVLEEISTRFDEIEKLPQDVQDRIILNETPLTPEEIINAASSIPNLGIVAVDFADLMIRGDSTESSMAHIYRTLMLGSKELHVPIILVSQLNRQGGAIP